MDWENISIAISKEGIWVDEVLFCRYLKTLERNPLIYFYRVSPQEFPHDDPPLSDQAKILTEMGVLVYEREIRADYAKKQGEKVRSGNLDVKIGIDVTDLLHRHGRYLRKVILVTGDADLYPIIDRVNQHRPDRPITVEVRGWNKKTGARLIRSAHKYVTLDRALPIIQAKLEPASVYY